MDLYGLFTSPIAEEGGIEGYVEAVKIGDTTIASSMCIEKVLQRADCFMYLDGRIYNTDAIETNFETIIIEE